MSMTKQICAGWFLGLALALAAQPLVAAEQATPRLRISGIYPHLTMYNQPPEPERRASHGECGTGAIVPWAGRLWCITYPQHQIRGSNDKLYEIDEQLNMTIRPESVGGTHASRLIHRESKQLIIGPYFIDAERHVRVADLQKLVGRMTATARHLTDPAHKVYFFDMEGAIYEADVGTLEITKLFGKPVPGWHGKGGYTAQGRFVIANNGEAGGAYKNLKVGGAAQGDEAGVLAEWDGTTWQIVERKQFTDVTGPGGIYGSPDEKSPLWSIGWDKRSVILKLLDGGRWFTFRLPKASHSFDPRHGWYTEWPRIREIGVGQMLAVMHGTMFDFPPGFDATHTGGIRPRTTHLRYIPDFCHWNGRIVLGADDSTMMENPLVGQAQSNFWFGTAEELTHFGPRAGWGGVWLSDEVAAGQASDPLLINGYDQRTLHVSHTAKQPVCFTVEVDRDGNGQWAKVATLDVPGKGYVAQVLAPDLAAQWLRITADQACQATAYFHGWSARPRVAGEAQMFDGLADVTQSAAHTTALIRPARHNRTLQVLASNVTANGAKSDERYLELDLTQDGQSLAFTKPAESRAEEVQKIAAIPTPFEVDDASVVLTSREGRRYRLPKGAAAYDEPWPSGWPRGIREAVSERYLANLHGTFYEIPRVESTGARPPDIERIKPVSSHSKRIVDFCTWRGLMVLSGVRSAAQNDGHVFTGEGGAGLWFGTIDDLWKLGKPVGCGGPWRTTAVKAGKPSDPYLMTGYDRKRLTLEVDGEEPVTVTLEINFDHHQWHAYQTFQVAPGKKQEFAFPAGFQAHWARLTANKDCRATATFVYE